MNIASSVSALSTGFVVAEQRRVTQAVGAGPEVSEKFEPLRRDRILSSVRENLRCGIARLEVLAETDSTNDVVLRAPARERHGYFVLAEHQTAGKGRKGRRWYSPPGGNIYLSFGWGFERMPAAFSLVVAMCVCRALQRIGLQGHGIKWPNDILVNGRKLVGILVETTQRRAAGDMAVTGIGINMAHETIARGKVDQPWTDLYSEIGTRAYGRNRIVALLIDELLDMLSGRTADIEGRLAEAWPRWDVLAGKLVLVTRGGATCEGRAAGITRAGALRVEVDSESGESMGERRIVEFTSGEASVRYA